jgi:2-iminobutanoate/2-iminopropanoate deaminase
MPLPLSAHPSAKCDSLGKMKIVCGLILISLGAAMPALAQKKIIQPKEFAAGGPFSPAVLVDGTLYVSGQIGRDLKTQQVPTDFEAEVRQVLDNTGIILREAKMNYSDVVSVQIYLTDMELFSRMNAVYTTYFKTDRPARTTVGVVKLAAPGAHVEIAVTARR